MNYQYPRGVERDYESKYRYGHLKMTKEMVNDVNYVVNMRYLMALSSAHAFYHQKCGYYKSCSCNENDYFYGALKKIRFDPRIILPVEHWEKEDPYNLEDDETTNPTIRYIQNKKY